MVITIGVTQIENFMFQDISLCALCLMSDADHECTIAISLKGIDKQGVILSSSWMQINTALKLMYSF